MLLGLAFTAMAQTPAPTPAEPVAPQAADAVAGDAAPHAPKDEVAKKECFRPQLPEGNRSRLAPRPDSKGRKCVNATGRSYTKDDLDSTGAIDLSDALRRLDPAVH